MANLLAIAFGLVFVPLILGVFVWIHYLSYHLVKSLYEEKPNRKLAVPIIACIVSILLGMWLFVGVGLYSLIAVMVSL